MKTMKTYWHNLHERERWILGIGIIAIILFLYYSLLYAPITTALEKNAEQLLEKRATLQWMKKINPENLPSTKVTNINNSQLLTLIARQLKESSSLKFPYQLQQTGSGDIQLSFEKVAFEKLINWLAGLGEQYNIVIKQFNVEKTETAGITKVTIIMSTGG